MISRSDPVAERLRAWWRDGDSRLRKQAMSHMDCRRCPDIVVSVAADATHPLQAEALGRMDGGFDTPEHTAIPIRALSHSAARVRAAAAQVLIHPEPVAAEDALIACAQEPDPVVASAATTTLMDFPTVKTVRCLARQGADQDQGQVHAEANESLAWIAGELVKAFHGVAESGSDRLRRWLRPVWDVLALPEENLELHAQDVASDDNSEHASPHMPPPQLFHLLADPALDMIDRQRALRSICWRDYQSSERPGILVALLLHPERGIRAMAAAALAAWNDVAGVLDLLRESDIGTQRAAVHALAAVPPSFATSKLILGRVDEQELTGIDADGGLAVFVRHEPRAAAQRRLVAIAEDRCQRESLRLAAVKHLARCDAAGVISRLAWVLQEPPPVTWRLHATLLSAMQNLSLPVPEIAHLENVDHLHVQAALAKLCA
jgi:hypothetical protein